MSDKDHSLVEHVVTEAVIHTVLDTACEGLGMAYSLLSASPVNEGEDRWMVEREIANAEHRQNQQQENEDKK